MNVRKNPGELIIDDFNYMAVVDPVVDGEVKSRGLIPRDYNSHPPGCYGSAAAVEIPLIPKSEWSDRIKEGNAQKSFLSHIVERGNNGGLIPSLDQNGQGYCWAYSSTFAVMALRAVMNQPYVRLSAHAVGCIIKNFRDQGGWGALSLDFITTRGVPSVELWPEKSMSRQWDNPATWENAALHKVTEGWYDLSSAPYDRKLTFDQVMTLLLSRVPVVGDFNWWGHSVCLLDPVEVEPGSFGVRIRNSWGDGWSDRGFGILRGSKAIPDGAVSPRVVTPSLN